MPELEPNYWDALSKIVVAYLEEPQNAPITDQLADIQPSPNRFRTSERHELLHVWPFTFGFTNILLLCSKKTFFLA